MKDAVIIARGLMCEATITKTGADPGGGGPRTPPGPQRGGPGPLFQNEENSIYYLQFYLIPPNKSL